MLSALACCCRGHRGRAPASASTRPSSRQPGSTNRAALAARLGIAVDGLRFVERLQLLADGSVLVIEVPRRGAAQRQRLLRLVRYRRSGGAGKPQRQVLHTMRGPAVSYPGHSGGVRAGFDGQRIVVWYRQQAALLDGAGALVGALALASAVEQASSSGALATDESIINVGLRGATLVLQTSRWRLLAGRISKKSAQRGKDGVSAWRQLEPPSKAWRGGRAALLLGAKHAFVVTDARQLRVYQLADGKRVGASTFPHPGSLEAALGPDGQQLFVSAVYSPPHSGVTYYRALVYGRVQLSRAAAKGRPLSMKGLPGGDERGAGVLGVVGGQLLVQPYRGDRIYSRALAGVAAASAAKSPSPAQTWCRTAIPTRDLAEVSFAGQRLAVLRVRSTVQKDGTSRLAAASVDIYNAGVLICRR